MIVHMADAEKHKLPSFKRLNGDYVSESYRVFAAIFTLDNANSSVRIKGLYDALHMITSPIGLSLFYLLSGHPNEDRGAGLRRNYFRVPVIRPK
jgi:hypothetical protein